MIHSNPKDMDTAKTVLASGQILYRISRPLWIIGMIGFCLLLFSLGIGYMLEDDAYRMLILDVADQYEFVILIVIACYIAIFLGVLGWFCCWIGLHLMGLGQIVINTMPQNSVHVATPSATAPVTPSTPAPAYNNTSSVAPSTPAPACNNTSSVAPPTAERTCNNTSPVKVPVQDNGPVAPVFQNEESWVCGKCKRPNMIHRTDCWACGTQKA